MSVFRARCDKNVTGTKVFSLYSNLSLKSLINKGMKKQKHHIIPRHIGGTDDPSNLIELTLEEHIQAHKDLYEEHGRWQDRIAYQMMSGQIGKEEGIRQIQREANLGNQNFLGGKHTLEARKKISDFQKKNMLGKKHALGHKKTEETKRIIAEKSMGNTAALGHKHTDVSKAKMSIAKSKPRKPLTEDHKENVSKAMKGNTNGRHKALKWSITDPSGKTFEITNLAKFARETGLQRANLATGHKSKGYTAVKIAA